MSRLTRKGGIALLVLLMALLLGGCGPQLAEGGWTAFTADSSAVYVGLPTGKFTKIVVDAETQKPVKKWEYPEKDNERLAGFYGTPVLEQGLVIFGASDSLGGVHKVYALDATTGKEKWIYPPAPAATQAQASLLDEILSLPDKVGALFGGGKDTNAEVAVPGPRDLIVGDLVVHEGTVYVTSADGHVYAFDLQTQQPRWRPFAAGRAIWGNVVRDGDKLFFGSMEHAVYALSAKDGTELWRFPARGDTKKEVGAIAGTPTVAGGTVYVGDLTGKFHAISAADGRETWTFDGARGWIWGQPALLDGKLYFGSLGGRVYALDAKTGEMVWPAPFVTRGAVRAGPVAAQDVVIDGVSHDVLYVASEDHHLYALDAVKGTSVWFNADKSERSFDAGAPLLTTPVVINDTVYVTTSDGRVFAVDAKTGAERWVYPQPAKK